MTVFVKTTVGSGVWYVVCQFPWFNLGPFRSEAIAFQIKGVIDDAYETGREEIRSGLRDILGLDNVGN